MRFRFRLMFTCVSRSKVSSFLLFKSRRWTADRSDPRGVPELCGRRPGFPLRAPAGVSPDMAALSLPVLPDTPPVLTGVTGAFLLQGSGARLGAMGGGCGAGATGSSPVLLCRFTSTRLVTSCSFLGVKYDLTRITAQPTA